MNEEMKKRLSGDYIHEIGEYDVLTIRQRWLDAYPESMPEEPIRCVESADDELEEDIELMTINFFDLVLSGHSPA